MAILHVSDPSLITVMATAVKLGQLVLQIIESNINMDPKKISFSVVVVDCS
jgi:hypothetical protein